MYALKIIIRTLAPVLATQAQSDEPNSATSLGFLPGSMIRGALVAHYQGVKLATDAHFRKLFLDGTVRFLHAYPAHGKDNYRSLPRPLSWLIEKDRSDDFNAPVYDVAVQKENLNIPMKSLDGEFFWRTNTSIQLYTAKRTMIVHNASNERTIKNSQTSQVFRYEALASDECFVSFIISPDADLLATFIPLLSGSFAIGGSHTAGYGRVEIMCTDALVEDWQEATEDTSYYEDEEEGQATLEESQTSTLTCLSDMVLPPTATSAIGWLTTVIGAQPQKEKTCYRLRIIGGFNRTWGLPLPQAWTLQAGSVFVFDQKHKPLLEPWVSSGIGGRLVEGFGRVAINLNALSDVSRTQHETLIQHDAAYKTPSLSEASTVLARRMGRRIWLAEAERQLAERISHLAGTIQQHTFTNLPSPAQLSQARKAAQQAWRTGDLEPVLKFVHDIKQSKLRRRDWENARVGDIDLLQWLEDQRTSTLFQTVDAAYVAGEMPAWTEQDWKRMQARLVEGVLRRARQVAQLQRDGGRR